VGSDLGLKTRKKHVLVLLYPLVLGYALLAFRICLRNQFWLIYTIMMQCIHLKEKRKSIYLGVFFVYRPTPKNPKNMPNQNLTGA
jgi:hypothetical protein